MPQPLLVLNTLEGPLQAVLEIQATERSHRMADGQRSNKRESKLAVHHRRCKDKIEKIISDI